MSIDDTLGARDPREEYGAGALSVEYQDWESRNCHLDPVLVNGAPTGMWICRTPQGNYARVSDPSIVYEQYIAQLARSRQSAAQNVQAQSTQAGARETGLTPLQWGLIALAAFLLLKG